MKVCNRQFVRWKWPDFITDNISDRQIKQQKLLKRFLLIHTHFLFKVGVKKMWNTSEWFKMMHKTNRIFPPGLNISQCENHKVLTKCSREGEEEVGTMILTYKLNMLKKWPYFCLNYVLLFYSDVFLNTNSSVRLHFELTCSQWIRIRTRIGNSDNTNVSRYNNATQTVAFVYSPTGSRNNYSSRPSWYSTPSLLGSNTIWASADEKKKTRNLQ